MKLFQYWDTGDPPADVAPLIEGLRRDNPEHDHRLFDRDAAAWLILKHFGERHRRAFDDCAVPAMQADLFRLCALVRYGGIYVDADCCSLHPLASLLAATPRNLMVTLDGYLTTGVMVFRGPGDPFLRAVLDLVLDNIEQRRFKNVYISTGPPVADAVRALADPIWFQSAYESADEWNRGMRFGQLVERAREVITVTTELQAATGSIRLITVDELGDWVGTNRPAYKSTDRDWRHWTGSIYAGPSSG